MRLRITQDVIDGHSNWAAKIQERELCDQQSMLSNSAILNYCIQFLLSTRSCYRIIFHMSFFSWTNEQLDHTEVKSSFTSCLSSPAEDSFTRVETMHHIETYANRFVTFSYFFCLDLSSGYNLSNEYFFGFIPFEFIHISLTTRKTYFTIKLLLLNRSICSRYNQQQSETKPFISLEFIFFHSLSLSAP